MRVLTVNAGSSSLKLRMLDADDDLAGREDLAADRGRVDERALTEALERLGPADAVGHRVVHGGRRFVEPVALTPDVERALRELIPLAPLHQPAALDAMEAVARALPRVPAVACFDTAFHARLPAAAATYALPAEWRERWGLRRFGFHGLSHAYAARRAAVPRVVTCHLGAGASLAAVRAGRSVDTTMGFTPAEGLVMASRAGTVDPGMLVRLLRDGVGLDELDDGLELRSGLTGLAGTGDMRQILGRVDAGDAEALLALEVYLHRLRALVAAMVASLGGLDALVFTGGVGENAAPVRAAAVAGLRFLGVTIDQSRNGAVAAGEDADVSGAEGDGRVLVVHSREDLEIARGTRTALAEI